MRVKLLDIISSNLISTIVWTTQCFCMALILRKPISFAASTNKGQDAYPLFGERGQVPLLPEWAARASWERGRPWHRGRQSASHPRSHLDNYPALPGEKFLFVFYSFAVGWVSVEKRWNSSAYYCGFVWLQYRHCVSNGDTTVLHQTINVMMD